MRNKYARSLENEEQKAQNEIRGVENGDGEEDEGSRRVIRPTMFAGMCGKYLRYYRNCFFKESESLATTRLQMMDQ